MIDQTRMNAYVREEMSLSMTGHKIMSLGVTLSHTLYYQDSFVVIRDAFADLLLSLSHLLDHKE